MWNLSPTSPFLIFAPIPNSRATNRALTSISTHKKLPLSPAAAMAANGTTSAWSPGTDPVGAPKFVDFRSDTTTYPTTEMFAAMSAASLGDDVFADDPSTAALEARVADLFGKEAGLLVLTGTMGNQIAVAAHLSASAPPHSIVLDSRSHIYKWEAGGVSYHTGAAVIPVPVPDGSWLTPDFIKSCWWSPASQDSHHAPCRLICVENTLDGAVFPIQKLRDLKQFAEESKVPVHMDGARLWNAAASGQATLREYADCADSISLCFSKGLGTPMGTVVVGSKTLIDRARKFRKIFGGGCVLFLALQRQPFDQIRHSSIPDGVNPASSQQHATMH